MSGNREYTFSNGTKPDFMVGTFPDRVATIIQEYSSQFTVFHCKSIKNNTILQLLSYISSVQKSVPRGFGEMLGEDIPLPGKVCYGAGDFDYTCESPCGKALVQDELLAEVLAFVAQRAEAFQLPAVHFGVCDDAFVAETLSLNGACRLHPLRHGRAALSLLSVYQFSRRHGMHPEMYVYTVQDGP